LEIGFHQFFVIGVVLFLVYALYRGLYSPALTFLFCVLALLVVGILGPDDVLKGLASQEVIVIFLLMLITSGMRSLFGSAFFTRLFNPELKPRVFLIRMMVASSSISAFLNNTPIVAFMIPYVKEWASQAGRPASKFLIPLSFATILGGTATVIGTSTNLILAGLIAEHHLPPLVYSDFLFLGIVVTGAGWIYLYTLGYSLLPSHENKIDRIHNHFKEYIAELQLYGDSPLVGKSVREAGLRNLQDVFLAEIIRKGKVISPIAPETVLEEGDALFFSGNTSAILNVIREENGLHLPEHERKAQEGQFNFVEAVIPANSELIGTRIRDSNFRKRYNATIVAIHRNGKRVPGRVGELELSGGDFLLLLARSPDDAVSDEKDLFIVSKPALAAGQNRRWLKWIGLVSFLLLVAGILGILPLFTASTITLVLLFLTGVLNLSEIRRQLDLGLLLILVCSLALGLALEKSGTASLIAQTIITVGAEYGIVGALIGLFLMTTLLTSLITNPAAVSIMFPIALSMSARMEIQSTPLFVAIAFAASGSFLTPIGYQTNLMVYGPGGYSFKDFVRIGIPFTLLYMTLCIGFIMFYYKLL
jgi:di/tricarboxylate transporter